MPYLLNNAINSNLQHPEIGTLPPLTAIEISDKQARTLKTLRNAIVFYSFIERELPKEIDNPKVVTKTTEDLITENKGDILSAIAEGFDNG